jgi:hypothetical protein
MSTNPSDWLGDRIVQHLQLSGLALAAVGMDSDGSTAPDPWLLRLLVQRQTLRALLLEVQHDGQQYAVVRVERMLAPHSNSRGR